MVVGKNAVEVRDTKGRRWFIIAVLGLIFLLCGLGYSVYEHYRLVKEGVVCVFDNFSDPFEEVYGVGRTNTGVFVKTRVVYVASMQGSGFTVTVRTIGNPDGKVYEYVDTPFLIGEEESRLAGGKEAVDALTNAESIYYIPASARFSCEKVLSEDGSEVVGLVYTELE